MTIKKYHLQYTSDISQCLTQYVLNRNFSIKEYYPQNMGTSQKEASRLHLFIAKTST
jgi:hypothetical protein